MIAYSSIKTSTTLSILLLLCFTASCSDNGGSEDPTGQPDESTDSSNDPSDSQQDEDLREPEPPFDYCEGEVPDDVCFANTRAPESDEVALARAIADKQLEEDPTALAWDWGEAVLMLGLAQLYRVTGDTDYRDYYQAYVDHHINRGIRITTSDNSAPAAVALALLREGQDETYQAVVDEALHYYEELALRSDEGGLNHYGIYDLPVSLWADSLFMFGNVLTGWGELSGEVETLDEYVFQFGVFTDLLQDENGLYRHAIYTPIPQDPDVYWARANGWIVAAAFDHLRVRGYRGESVPELQDAAERLVEAVIAVQDSETGLWWNILNRPDEIYLETSASALFAFGMARGYRNGHLDESVLPVIRRAMVGVVAAVDTDDDGKPVVTGISGPTTVGTFDDYAAVSLGDDISFGVGAVLLALTETAGLPQE